MIKINTKIVCQKCKKSNSVNTTVLLEKNIGYPNTESFRNGYAFMDCVFCEEEIELKVDGELSFTNDFDNE